MSEKKGNTFFPKEIFETKIGLEMNKDILYSLYKSGVTPEASLPIEFFFMSDHEEKIKRLYLFLVAKFPDYSYFKSGLKMTNMSCPVKHRQLEWIYPRLTPGTNKCGIWVINLIVWWMGWYLKVPVNNSL